MTLIDAHKELEDFTLVKEFADFKSVNEKKMTELIYDGLWFSPLQEALDAFLQETQQNVTGTVRVKLFKGHAIVEGRKSHILFMMKIWQLIQKRTNSIMMQQLDLLTYGDFQRK